MVLVELPTVKDFRDFKSIVYHVMAYLYAFTMFPGKMALVELRIVKDFHDAKTSRLSCDGLLKCV